MSNPFYRFGISTLPIGFGLGLAILATLLWSLYRHLRRSPVLPRHRHRAVWSATLVILLVLEAAWGLNAYFDYFPDLGALLGRRAADQAAAAAVLQVRMPSPTEQLPTHGSVIRVPIPGERSGFSARDAEIYLPPAWFSRNRPRLPVVELIAGEPGTPEDWTRGAFADLTADRYAQTHGGRAPILVMPDPNGAFDRDSECVNGRQGEAEDYLTIDVPRWVHHNLESEQASGRWGIGGLSAGGYCAAMLGLRHPDVYSLFLDFGGLDTPSHAGGPQHLFKGNPTRVAHSVRDYSISHLLRGRTSHKLAGWFEVGSADQHTTKTVLLDAALARHRLGRTVLVVLPGGHHTFRVWRHALSDSLGWATDRLSNETCPVERSPGSRLWCVPVTSTGRNPTGRSPTIDVSAGHNGRLSAGG